ncbi:hypothetical protein [Nocardia jiangsuensis]|uniref:Uncharacterized protein n=1 Tax=Nocardia jiangsuensis TaxID=1691563 RepID=A0ABV8E2C0_9NOCA
MVSGKVEPDRIESLEKKAEKACKNLNDILWDDQKYLEYITHAAGVIQTLAGDRGIDRELGRNRDFTEQFMKALL